MNRRLLLTASAVPLAALVAACGAAASSGGQHGNEGTTAGKQHDGALWVKCDLTGTGNDGTFASGVDITLYNPTNSPVNLTEIGFALGSFGVNMGEQNLQNDDGPIPAHSTVHLQDPLSESVQASTCEVLGWS